MIPHLSTNLSLFSESSLLRQPCESAPRSSLTRCSIASTLNKSCVRYYQWLKKQLLSRQTIKLYMHTCLCFCISGIRDVSECFVAVVFCLSLSRILSKRVCTHIFCLSFVRQPIPLVCTLALSLRPRWSDLSKP